uniref:Uncharacterized protein n=1 Tax=Acrobeloides nanus TaxID=290746 RepID=A0A914CCD7_9BILA
MLLKLAACLAICVPMILSEPAAPDAAAASAVKPIAKGSYGHQERDYDRGNDHYRGRDEGYDHHRGHDGYDNHPDHYRHHEHYNHHGHFSYDTHYCSVHASFALVLPRDKDYTPADNNYGKDNNNYGKDNNNYGKDNNNYGKDDNYGRRSHHHRFFARQFCRYAATQNHDACKFCCRVAARSANTSPDDIVAAIFAFDPANPTGNGAGYDGDDEGYGHGGGPYRKKRNAVGIPIKQCVCCAPKRDY